MYAQGAGVIADIDMWHKHIEHVNLQRLKAMQMREVATRLPKFRMNDMQNVCEACQFGKQSRHAFAKERNVSERPLQVIHSDVWGPTRIAFVAGSSYNVTFIDDHTGKVWLYCMKAKSKVF